MKLKIRQLACILLSFLMLACMAPVAAAADTVYVQDANIISQGTIVLKGTYQFNCETGKLENGGDIWWEQVNSTVRKMVPQSPATILNLGKVDFNSLVATKLDDYNYNSTPIIGSNNSTNKLVKDDVFVVKTKHGNYSKIKVLNYDYNLTIQWVTYSAPLATPTLLTPANGKAFFHYPRTTTLSWKPVAGASYYKVESQYYSTTWESNADAIVSGVNNTSYSFNFVGDQKGRWRVTAYSSNTFSSPSQWFEFSYSTLVQLTTPVLLSPVNNMGQYNYPRTTTLAWKPVPGCTGYLIEIQYYSGNTWTPYPNVTVDGVVNSSYTFDFTGAQPGRWRITALGSSPYKNSAPSAWWTFIYKI